jgi:type IV secretion system protein VirD4
MAYSRWATVEELKSKLTPVSYDSEIKKSGIPMMYEDKNLYIKDDEEHTMVIGATGCGKTQTITLPQLRLAIKAKESFIVHDVKGEIYDILSGELKKQNYNTIVINLDNPTVGNNFNPLYYPYELYKKGQKDDAIELLENVGYYFCCDEKIDKSVDPFWTNSAISLFVGVALYLFENAKEDEINLRSLLNIVYNFDKFSEEVKKCDKTSDIYINASNIVLAPNETRGSILAVFLQQIRLFVSRETLLKMISTSNFDITNIQKEKTALFIISNNRTYSRKLIPLIIEECYYAATNNNDKTRRLNFVIDDFENLIPIKDFNNMLTLARSLNIKFSIFIRSLLELRNNYGKEETEILKIVFGNIVYLLANDTETLEDISKLCGNQQTDKGIEPLITVEDLKLLNNFEAVILIPRIYPIKTKLLPDYQIDWKFSDEKVDFKELENRDFKIFEIK